MARRRSRKSRPRRRRSRLTSGLRGSALQVATGVVTSLGHQVIAERVDAVRNNWWAGGAVIAGVGFLLKRRPKVSPLGDAMIGAGGYAIGLAYQMQRAGAAVETGALLGPGDIAGLQGGNYMPLDDQLNPSSQFYVEPGTPEGDINDALELE